MLCCSPATQVWPSTSFLYNPPPCPSKKKDDLKWETISSICLGLWFRRFILHILILLETPCRCGGALSNWPLVKRQTARNQKHDREDKQLFRSQLLARMATSSEMSLILILMEEVRPWGSFVRLETVKAWHICPSTPLPHSGQTSLINSYILFLWTWNPPQNSSQNGVQPESTVPD